MIPSISVFVNEKPITLAGGSQARDAVAAWDPLVLPALETGAAYLTDGRGIELNPKAPLASGSIIRVVVSARAGSRAGS